MSLKSHGLRSLVEDDAVDLDSSFPVLADQPTDDGSVLEYSTPSGSQDKPAYSGAKVSMFAQAVDITTCAANAQPNTMVEGEAGTSYSAPQVVSRLSEKSPSGCSHLDVQYAILKKGRSLLLTHIGRACSRTTRLRLAR